MLTASSFTRSQILRFLTFLGYPFDDQPGSFALLLLEGVVPDLEQIGGGSRWTFEGDLSEVWTSGHTHQLRPRPEVRAVPAPSRIDRCNELLIGVGRTPSSSPIFWGVLANMDAGTVFGDDRRGWPRLADGLHRYSVSVRHEGPHRGMPCLRPLVNGNRVVRELPSGANGGDGVLTLTEFLNQDDPAHAKLGYAYNASILCHPGDTRDSASCWGTAGGYDTAAWGELLSGARMQERPNGFIPVVVWRGADLLLWQQAGEPAPGVGAPPWSARWRPAVRPGCEGPWVAALQRLLRVQEDGRFGKGTGRALLERRRRAGLDESMPAVEAPEWAALEART